MNEHDSRNYEFYKNNPHIKFIPYAEKVLEHYEIYDYSFGEKEINDYNDIEEYHTELYESGIFEDLCGKIADEIFYLMFNNRRALLNFNKIVSDHLKYIDLDNIEEEDNEAIKPYITKSGTLKRIKIPEWCKKAVYFRDRGKCCLCHHDLSKILSLNNIEHYDHIVPLAEGGLNDVANIQLLCASCNLSKGSRYVITSDMYEGWF